MNLHTVFHTKCTNFHSHQRAQVLFLHMLVNSCYFLIIAVDKCEVICYCGFDLHFLMGLVVWSIFSCVLALFSMSSMGKCLFQPSAYFLIRFFFFMLYEFFVYFECYPPVSHTVCKCLPSFSRLQNNFSSCVKLFNLMSHLFTLLLFPLSSVTNPKYTAGLMSKGIMFSSRSFMASGLTFMSLIYFKFVFVYIVRTSPVLFLCMQLSMLPSNLHLLRNLSFPHCILATSMS